MDKCLTRCAYRDICHLQLPFARGLGQPMDGRRAVLAERAVDVVELPQLLHLVPVDVHFAELVSDDPPGRRQRLWQLEGEPVVLIRPTRDFIDRNGIRVGHVVVGVVFIPVLVEVVVVLKEHGMENIWLEKGWLEHPGCQHWAYPA